MVRDQIIEYIKLIFEEQGITDIPELDGDLRLVGFNSRGVVNLIVKLEDCYDIEFDDDDLELALYPTVDAITKLVEGYIN